MSEISTLELNEAINNNFIFDNKNVKILFTTMTSGPGLKPNIVKDSADKKIPHSIFFDFQKTVADRKSATPNTMPSSEQFQQNMRDLGINRDDFLVIYDDFGNFCASRVWFMLKVAGHRNLAVLRGGLPKWLAENRPTQIGLSLPNEAGDFSFEVNSTYTFVDSNTILKNIETQELCLLDARSAQRFSGKEAEVKEHLRSGHIPKATNLHYAALQENYGEFIEEDKLKSHFPDIKSCKNGLIFSCGSGVTACILAQAADKLGISPLYVYDGSWSEWGADDSLPIEMSC